MNGELHVGELSFDGVVMAAGVRYMHRGCPLVHNNPGDAQRCELGGDRKAGDFIAWDDLWPVKVAVARTECMSPAQWLRA